MFFSLWKVDTLLKCGGKKKREYKLVRSPNKLKVKCKSEGEEEKKSAVILFFQNKTNEEKKHRGEFNIKIIGLLTNTPHIFIV